MTRQLLAFGRKQMLQPRVIDLNKVITLLTEMLERVIPASIKVTMRLDPNLSPILFDPTQIEQVLLNLVINARDAMPSGGRLIVETSNIVLDTQYEAFHPGLNPGSYVLLSVSDTGVGIALEHQTSVFEPFFTTKNEGTGLGLSTVHGIVKQSGGHVYLYSEPGIGTTFKLYLPAANQTSEIEEQVRPAPKGGSELILLVEDDSDVREYCNLVLEAAGYRVMAAATPQKAIELVQSSAPVDLLFTDVVLPQMNGPELAQRLHALQPTMKVLFASGYTENASIHTMGREDAAHFLSKPYTKDQLLGSVRLAIESPQA